MSGHLALAFCGCEMSAFIDTFSDGFILILAMRKSMIKEQRISHTNSRFQKFITVSPSFPILNKIVIKDICYSKGAE